jgi:hypothetical protein
MVDVFLLLCAFLSDIERLGFRNEENGSFVGELTDPIKVKLAGSGLVTA